MIDIQEKIFCELKRCPGTAADVAHALDVTVADIRADLREMRSNGVLEIGARGTYQVVGSDKGQRVAGSAGSVKDSQMAKAPLPERGKAVKKKAAAAAKKPEKKAGPQKAPAAPAAPAAPVAEETEAAGSNANKGLNEKTLSPEAEMTLAQVLDSMEERLNAVIPEIAIQNKDEKLNTLARLAEMSPDPLKSVLVEIADDLHGIEAA